jgi:DNA-binding NarL/FixJ family response regulator
VPGRDFSREPLRVLIVEDERIFAETLRHYLDLDERITVVDVAAAFRPALAAAMSQGVELALVDVKLGYDDGYAVIQALHDIRPEIVSVMMSGLDVDRFLDRAMRCGAAAAVEKSSFVEGGSDLVIGWYESTLAARGKAEPGAA